MSSPAGLSSTPETYCCQLEISADRAAVVKWSSENFLEAAAEVSPDLDAILNNWCQRIRTELKFAALKLTLSSIARRTEAL